MPEWNSLSTIFDRPESTYSTERGIRQSQGPLRLPTPGFIFLATTLGCIAVTTLGRPSKGMCTPLRLWPAFPKPKRLAPTGRFLAAALLKAVRVYLLAAGPSMRRVSVARAFDISCSGPSGALSSCKQPTD